MKFRRLISYLALLICEITFAQSRQQKGQEFLYGPTIGYSNQAGNFGKIGAFGEIELGNNSMLKLDVNSNITGMKNKLSIIPETGLTLYVFPNRLGGLGIFAETEFTPFTFTPKAGISLFTFIDFGFGYGFEMQQKNNFKPIDGFQFSFGINLPLNFNIY